MVRLASGCEQSELIRITIPFHLRTLARVDGEIAIDLAGDRPPTRGMLLDALEERYPMLRGTIRDHVTKTRRPFIRFYACRADLTHDPDDAPLPQPVARGEEPFMIVGAIAGG